MSVYGTCTSNFKLAQGFRDKLSSANMNLNDDAGTDALLPEHVTALESPMLAPLFSALKLSNVF